jgi:hypothetical protein
MISPELNVVQDRVQGKRGEREMKRWGERKTGREGIKDIRFLRDPPEGNFIQLRFAVYPSKS